MAESRPDPARQALPIALGDLRGDGLRTALAIAALIPLVVAYFIVFAIAESLIGVNDRVPADASLAVVSTNVLDISSGSIDDEMLASLERLGGDDVAEVTPMIMRAIRVDDTLLQLRAADIATWQDEHALELLSGALPASSDEVVVTEGAVLSAGWEVGSVVEIYGSDFRISGVMRAPGTKAISVWMPLKRAQQLFETRDDYQIAFLRPAAGVDVDALAERIRDDPGIAGSYEVVFESRVLVAGPEWMRTLGQIGFFAVALAIAMIGFGTFNFASLVLAERRREAGVMRALGFSPSFLRRVIAARVAVVTLTAFLIGWGIADLYLSTRSTVAVNTIALDFDGTQLAALVGFVIVGALAWMAGRIAARRYLRSDVADLLEH